MCWMLLNSHLHAQRRSFLYWLRLHNIKVGTQISHYYYYYYYWMTCSKRDVLWTTFFSWVYVRKLSLFLPMLFPVYCIKIDTQLLLLLSTSIILVSFSKMVCSFLLVTLWYYATMATLYTNTPRWNLHKGDTDLLAILSSCHFIIQATGDLVNSAITAPFLCRWCSHAFFFQ